MTFWFCCAVSLFFFSFYSFAHPFFYSVYSLFNCMCFAAIWYHRECWKWVKIIENASFFSVVFFCFFCYTIDGTKELSLNNELQETRQVSWAELESACRLIPFIKGTQCHFNIRFIDEYSILGKCVSPWEALVSAVIWHPNQRLEYFERGVYLQHKFTMNIHQKLNKKRTKQNLLLFAISRIHQFAQAIMNDNSRFFLLKFMFHVYLI